MSNPIQLGQLTQRFVAHMRVSPDVAVSEAAPVCAVCQGFGWLRYDVPVGDPKFGKLYRCTAPECAVREAQLRDWVQRMMDLSDWKTSYAHWTFESFRSYVDSLPSKQKGGAMAYKNGAYCLAYTFAGWEARQPFTKEQAAQFVLQREWPPEDDDGLCSHSLVLSSAPGMGKTSLALAATNALWAQNRAVLYISARELIEKFNKTYQPHYEGKTAHDIAMSYADMTYLVLDELTVPNPTDKQIGLFTDLLRERERKGLPTLITTNHTTERFEQGWGEAMTSTLRQSHWAGMSGDVIRPQSRMVTI